MVRTSGEPPTTMATECPGPCWVSTNLQLSWLTLTIPRPITMSRKIGDQPISVNGKQKTLKCVSTSQYIIRLNINIDYCHGSMDDWKHAKNSEFIRLMQNPVILVPCEFAQLTVNKPRFEKQLNQNLTNSFWIFQFLKCSTFTTNSSSLPSHHISSQGNGPLSVDKRCQNKPIIIGIPESGIPDPGCKEQSILQLAIRASWS